MRPNLKTMLLASVFCVGVTAANQTPAHARELKPYMGLDLQRISYDYNSSYDAGGGITLDGGTLLNENLDSFNVHVGTRVCEHVGVEVGYFRSREESTSIATGATVGPGVVAATDFKTDVKVQGISRDALAYVPLGEEKRVELIGTVGATWTKGEVTLTVPTVATATVDKSEFGLRVGAGLQVHVTDHINLRGLLRYQQADFDNVAEHAVTYSAGMNYIF